MENLFRKKKNNIAYFWNFCVKVEFRKKKYGIIWKYKIWNRIIVYIIDINSNSALHVTYFLL